MTLPQLALVFNIIAGLTSAVIHGVLALAYVRSQARMRVIVLMITLAVIASIVSSSYIMIVFLPDVYRFVSQNILRSTLGMFLMATALASFLVYQYQTEATEQRIAAHEARIREAEREVTIQHMLRKERERERVLEEVKRGIVNNIGHEIRTPVTIITGYIQMILAGEFGLYPASLNEPLISVKTNARRIELLVRRFTVYIRDVVISPFDLYGLVCEAINGRDIWIGTRRKPEDINLTCINGDVLPIEADEDKIKTAVFELINNAIKFTDKGGSVAVAVEDREDEIAITVSDTGIGIARRDHMRIFESLIQLRMDAARPFEGTGMGLTVARSVAEMHGGHLEVDSAPGRGSTFRMVLPK